MRQTSVRGGEKKVEPLGRRMLSRLSLSLQQPLHDAGHARYAPQSLCAALPACSSRRQPVLRVVVVDSAAAALVCRFASGSRTRSRHAGRQNQEGRGVETGRAEPEAHPPAQLVHPVRPSAVHPTRPLTAPTRVCSARCRLRDGPSNALLALETRLADLSFDSAGYPLGIALNALHLLVRLPSFYAALPALSELWPGASAATGTDASSVQAASRYARRMATADARLEALQRQAANSGAQGWIRWTAWISFALVLFSVANAAYLATRRRQYQMVLRRVSPGLSVSNGRTRSC